MTRKQTERAEAPHPSHTHGTDAGVVAGELVGAILGSVAGPAGTVAGMVVGAIAGALTGHVLEEDEHRARLHDEELDETIGVSGGDIGAARPTVPPGPAPAPENASVDNK
jgi:hypothetical protein